MTLYLILALANGVCIALSRILNGQLSVSQGAFKTSYINHLIGFIFLSVLILILFEPPQLDTENIALYSGGVIDALYVAVNSAVMSKLGSTNAIILVISGQMLFSVLLDSSLQSGGLMLKVTGVTLIVAGIALKEYQKSNRVLVTEQIN